MIKTPGYRSGTGCYPGKAMFFLLRRMLWDGWCYKKYFTDNVFVAITGTLDGCNIVRQW